MIAEFVRNGRKLLRLTQAKFTIKAGVVLTVIRKIEQGKEILNLSKVNQVLIMFGHILGPLNVKEF